MNWKRRLVATYALGGIIPVTAERIGTTPAPIVIDPVAVIAAENAAADTKAAAAGAVNLFSWAPPVAPTPTGRLELSIHGAAELPPEVFVNLPSRSGSSDTPSSAPDAPSPRVSYSVPGPPAATYSQYNPSQRERETLAACLILEAASQGEYGMRAVMAVIRNRAEGEPERFVPTVLRPKQFSALNRVTAGLEPLSAAIARARRDRMWPVALTIVEAALGEPWHDPTGGATHYTRSAERTRWTRNLARTTTIGAHSFYR